MRILCSTQEIDAYRKHFVKHSDDNQNTKKSPALEVEESQSFKSSTIDDIVDKGDMMVS